MKIPGLKPNFGRIIRWQIIPEYSQEDIKLRHYRILNFLGARLHRNDMICAYEYRLCRIGFAIFKHNSGVGTGFEVPIPFLRHDWFFAIKWVKRPSYQKSKHDTIRRSF